eukprot:1856306-Rhodomonas_salina.1
MELRCPECDLTRGTRTYRKTKIMKEKEKKAASKARKRAKKTSSSTASPSTPPSASLSDGVALVQAATMGVVQASTVRQEKRRV